MKTFIKKIGVLMVSVILGSGLFIQAAESCNYVLLNERNMITDPTQAVNQAAYMFEEQERQLLNEQYKQIVAEKSQGIERCVSVPLDVSDTDIGLLKKNEGGVPPYTCVHSTFTSGGSVVVCRSSAAKVGSNATVVFESVTQCPGNGCLRIGKSRNNGAWYYLRKK